MQIAKTLVFRGISEFYLYQIPDNQSDIQIGTHVEIPLGKGKAEGLIIEILQNQTEYEEKKIKPILNPLPKRPTVNPELINLIIWFSKYYLVTPYKAYQTVIGSMKLRKLPPHKNTNFQFNDPNYELTQEQNAAIQTILSNPKPDKYLIFGVTASGKTEVYIQIAKKVLKQNKSVLILVPEIALTPQITQTFRQRFGPIVAIIHSGLTPKEHEIEWNKIYQGQCAIVIGARSAVFTPLQNIGLIIVDEEHEPSYKQESNPRYFTHSIVEVRANYHKAIQIYGSATPSVETYYKMAQSSPNAIISLKNRVNKQKLPKVLIADMKEERANGNDTYFSKLLLSQIKEKIEKKERIIILINRRGFSTYISCQSCGTILTCPQCNLSYTYHKDKIFRCHRCFTQLPLTHVCPKCHKPRLSFSGIGIQKAELELTRFFPNTTIQRIDKDSTPNVTKLENELTDFKATGSILLGTQLIAKGHHFEDVTLVGVLGIDTTLNLPDFRSSQRVFQLLTQVAGRAGRSQKEGTVIIQTYEPDHPAIIHATNHNFIGFYEEELGYRKQLNYPPFSQLINIICSSKNEFELKKYTSMIHFFLKEHLKEILDKIDILGPRPAPIERIKDYYRYHFLLKCEPEIIPKVKEVLSQIPTKIGIRNIIDFDPRSLL